MRLFLGNSGLDKGKKGWFNEKIKCKNCGSYNAHIMFVASEERNERWQIGQKIEHICDLRPKNARNWVHNLCAIALYFCGDCSHVQTILEQEEI